MIDDKIAGREIGRMIGLDFFPREKAAMKELVSALACASTEPIAVAVISGWIADCTQCPKPADIRRLVGDKNTERAQAAKKCEECGGSGFVIVEGWRTFHGVRMATSGASPCRCRGTA